jgi:superfamily II DNA or RNA helicase
MTAVAVAPMFPVEGLFGIPAVRPAECAVPGLADALVLPFGGTGYAPRDYQREDVLACLQAWCGGARGVIFKEATGLGKSVIVAELARRLSLLGRVLVVVDVGILADDLLRTVERHTGRTAGVLTGDLKDRWRSAQIVVATVQTLYAGGREHETYRLLNPRDFAAVLVDECETSIAERYQGCVRHFLDGNPQLVAAGLSATPRRGDGQGMGKLYDYARQEPGALNRTILWGRDNGWLVHVRQAFVRVSIDFSTLKLRKDDEGEKDYAEADLLRLFDSEQKLIELAKGIHGVAEERPAIVICPNSIEFAKALAHHLDACRRGCAEAVHGKQGRRCDDLLVAYKRGDYPYVVSVNKLYKGFDADRVRMVFMCRKTRSARLYEQALGRGTRPLVEIRPALDSEPDPQARRAIIAASDKPAMVMVDMVGINPSAKDMGVIDILAGDLSADARQRAKRKLIKAGGEQETEQAGREAEKEIAREHEEAERRKRRRLEVQAQVQVEYSDDLRASAGGQAKAGVKGIPEGMRDFLIRNKVRAEDVNRMSLRVAAKLFNDIKARRKARLCSYGQAQVLRRAGYDKSELHSMTFDAASSEIERVKANGWRRPVERVA